MACPLSWCDGVPTLIIALRINSETSARIVDRGPPADEKDSAQSKEFKPFGETKQNFVDSKMAPLYML